MFHLGGLSTRSCQTHSRREMLQLGACSALGLGLPHWTATHVAGESTPRPKAKSVLLVWMWGGPSHHEMWDPKPNAPAPIRGPFRPIATSVPDTRISELLPMTARCADRFSIVRSMAHDQTDHNVGGTITLTGNIAGAQASGGIPFPGRVRPSVGSLVSYLTRDRLADWPAYTVIGSSCVVSGAPLRGQTAEALGAAHDPFRLEGFSFDHGVRLPASLEPVGDVGTGRLSDRRRLLSELDAEQRRLEESGAVDHYSGFRQRAFGLLTSSRAKASLQLDAEPDAVRDRYGRTVFGQNCVVARRLIESGVPFVQVNWSGDAEDEQQGGDGGWDLHYRLFERMQDRYCPIFDRAFSALIEDMHQRGLLESTIVLAMGEFGRSPKISEIGGREHWPFGYSIVATGGGIEPGRVVGATSGDGGYPATRPIHPVDVHCTVLENLGLDRLRLFEKEVPLLGSPIAELG
jgi:hypothetical protein